MAQPAHVPSATLSLAVDNNHLAYLKWAFEQSRMEHPESLFHRAVRKGRLEIIEWFRSVSNAKQIKTVIVSASHSWALLHTEQEKSRWKLGMERLLADTRADIVDYVTLYKYLVQADDSTTSQWLAHIALTNAKAYDPDAILDKFVAYAAKRNAMGVWECLVGMSLGLAR